MQVRNFGDEFLAREGGGARGDAFEPIVDLPYNRAILTDGVHVYANLTGFNDVLLDQGRETAASHGRTLQFLHLHYSAIDRLLEAYEVQRVDHHGSRVHAVVLTPVGAGNVVARIQKAMSLAAAIRRMVGENVRHYGGEYETDVRIGIDSGQAVALNGGKGSEKEPVFIGNPANYAAKLAAGSEPGIYISNHAAAKLGGSRSNEFKERLTSAAESAVMARPIMEAVGGQRLAARVLAVFDEQDGVRRVPGTPDKPDFIFHRHEPPLRAIDFSALSPSNSIRQEMAGVFADLDRFTAYVASCIEEQRIGEAVANLHVLRGELARVLRDDFAGKKVRFIGDCIFGVLACGDHTTTDMRETVEKAVLCAGGMRSSFEICRSMLPGAGMLGLQIGLETGFAPVTRLGIRGGRSVRCCAAKAVCVAEAEQGRCRGSETAIGENAISYASATLRRAFGEGRKIPGLDYASANAFVHKLVSPAISKQAAEPLRPHGM